ncbi:hypothetical protein B0H13DRAFT_2075498 [Mycena leptocephala]|nr:hypothetical protein B0H13DRAFT_2075498 [Mycena leptocephala]
MLFSCLFLSSYRTSCLSPPSFCSPLLTSLSRIFSMHFFAGGDLGFLFGNGGYISALPCPYSSPVLSLHLRSPSSSLSPPRSPLPLLYPLSSYIYHIFLSRPYYIHQRHAS